MIERRVFIFVNGILAAPGRADAWTDRAVTWVHTHAPHDRAEKFEYLSGAISRRLFQGRRAAALAELIDQYAPSRAHLHLVGHSNGCDIILRALRGLKTFRSSIKIEPNGSHRWAGQTFSLHLISPACEADFDKSGLNELLMLGVVRRVGIYIAGRDRALDLASWSTRLLSWIGLGYGTLGKTGPQNNFSNRVVTHVEPDFNHSTWFEGGNFYRTMELITNLHTS